MYSKNTWIVILLVLGVISDALSYFVDGPRNFLGTTGSNVSFKCITDMSGCSNIEWLKLENLKSPTLIYREDRGMLNPMSFDPKRYSVSAVDGCNLSITNLKLEDSGRFICTETRDGSEKSRSAILVVVGIEPKPCESNITDMAAEGDGYSMSCSVTIPKKSLEQSNVTMSWFSESKTLINSVSSNNEQQHSPLVLVHGGKAEPPAVPFLRCDVSFPPEPDPNYDQSPASLIVCSLQKKNVSYYVRNIRFSPDKFSRGKEVTCVADGFPPPSFIWKNMKTGENHHGATIIISDDSLPGDKYECNATNVIKGTYYHETLEATVSEENTAAIGILIGIIVSICVVLVVVVLVLCFVLTPCPLHKKACKKKSDSCDIDDGSVHPLKPTPSSKSATSSPPPKPPRASQNTRPPSEVQYAQIAADRPPYARPSNPSNASSTIYASIRDA